MRSTRHHHTRVLAQPVAGRQTWWRWALAGLAAAAPLPLFAQTQGQGGNGFMFNRPVVSLSIRGGYERPNASSDIYRFATEQLTLSKGDFAAAGFHADLGVRVTERLEIVASGGSASRQAPSDFRKFVGNDDKPIEQVTTLRRTPMTLGLRYALTPPGDRIGKFAWIPNRLTPWIGAGAGYMGYAFRQSGDFVDFKNLNVFNQTLSDNGFAPMAYAHVALDLRLSTRLALTGDLRYSAARAAMGQSFEGFDKIDLSGTAATMGLTVRY